MIVRSTRPRVTLVLILTGVTLAGCHSGSHSNPGPIGTTSSSPSPDAQAIAKHDALAAYTGMWAAMVKAAETSNPDEPKLRQYATGDALALLVGSLVTDRSRGVVTKGHPVLNPSVTALTPESAPTEASIVDCGDSTNWLKYKSNGELADNTPGGRRRITATVKAGDGGWKVTSTTVGGLGSC